MADYKKLLVYHKAHALNLRVAGVAQTIRGADFLSLRRQMVRAAHSITSNIVEGRAQSSDANFARFLGIALNSSSELEYHLITARDLRIIKTDVFNEVVASVVEVRMMLHGFIATLKHDKHA